MLVIADMLLTMSVYVLIPIMPLWLMNTENFSPLETGLSMGAYAAALHAIGGMDRDLLLIAKDDELGRKLQDLALLS